MKADIKTVKFSGTLKDFEYTQGKPTRAFLKDVVSEGGKICKSFYWFEYRDLPQKNINQLKQLNKGEQASFTIKY